MANQVPQSGGRSAASKSAATTAQRTSANVGAAVGGKSGTRPGVKGGTAWPKLRQKFFRRVQATELPAKRYPGLQCLIPARPLERHRQCGNHRVSNRG